MSSGVIKRVRSERVSIFLTATPHLLNISNSCDSYSGEDITFVSCSFRLPFFFFFFVHSIRASLLPRIHAATHPSIRPLTHPYTHSSTHPPTHPLIHPSIHSSTHSSIHSSTNPSTHPSTHPLTHPSTHPSTHPPIHPSTHPQTHSAGLPLAVVFMAKQRNLGSRTQTSSALKIPPHSPQQLPTFVFQFFLLFLFCVEILLFFIFCSFLPSIQRNSAAPAAKKSIIITNINEQ